jgi:aspartate/methionine/tyrosine aminotransferase
MDADFCIFALEHYQSLYERSVEYNLADSSVKCVSTGEWLDDDEKMALLNTELFYPEVNGTKDLRSAISKLYAKATASNILVTVGASQANNLVCQTLLNAGDHVLIMSPGYRQVWGIAKNMGCTVHELQLQEEFGWRLDLDQLDRLVSGKTKLVSVVNPNNPTGTVLTAAEMESIVTVCRRAGAWLHVDEVYHGTEHPGVDATPSFWGMYDKLVCTNSLSKAYGLSGLRIGWAIAPPDVVDSLWRRHEYSVIAAAAPSMALAEIALRPAKRNALLDRQRRITQAGLAVLREWLTAQVGLFSLQPTQATSIVLLRCHLTVPSLALAEAMRTRASVLVAPGAALGAEHHIRVTVGYEPDKVRSALDRIAAVVRSLAAGVADGPQEGAAPVRPS